MTLTDHVLAALAATVAISPAFGMVVVAALVADAMERRRRLPDWDKATGPMEGTFSEERDPELTELERQAQAEDADTDGARP